MEKTNYAQKLIFELTHNWSIANKGARSLGIDNSNGHRVYEITMRKTGNVVRLHLIVNDKVKAVVVEPNDKLAIVDYVELQKIGKKVTEKVGIDFESDTVVEENLSMKVVKRKSTVINEKVEVKVKVKESSLDKLNKRIEALLAKKEELEQGQNSKNAKNVKNAKKAK